MVDRAVPSYSHSFDSVFARLPSPRPVSCQAAARTPPSRAARQASGRRARFAPHLRGTDYFLRLAGYHPATRAERRYWRPPPRRGDRCPSCREPESGRRVAKRRCRSEQKPSFRGPGSRRGSGTAIRSMGSRERVPVVGRYEVEHQSTDRRIRRSQNALDLPVHSRSWSQMTLGLRPFGRAAATFGPAISPSPA